MQQEAQQFFEDFLGKSCTAFYALEQSGSARRNFVGESDNQKFIVTFNKDIRENKAFFYFSEVFSGLQLNTPEIFKISNDQLIYVQEFLGKQTLSQIIEQEGLSDRVKGLVKQSLEKLFILQSKTQNQIDYNQTFEYEAYDELPILHDLFYFKNFMVDVLGLHYHKSTLLKEFKQLVSVFESFKVNGLMIRDFQSRNIMVNDEDEVYFIDYQSAMKGPLSYDVVSFLFQAKANFPEDFQNEMLEYYYSFWDSSDIVSELKQSVDYVKLLRFLQVLGAYGFRGLIQRKAHFIASIEKGIDNVFNFSQFWAEMSAYPELKKLINALYMEKSSIVFEH